MTCVKVELTRQNRKAGVALFAMNKITQEMRFRQQEFYACHKFYSFADFLSQLAVRQRQYNNFPMPPLNWLSPKQVLSSFPDL